MTGTIHVDHLPTDVRMVYARRDGVYVAGTIRACFTKVEEHDAVLHCREVLMAPYGQIADQCQHLFNVTQREMV